MYIYPQVLLCEPQEAAEHQVLHLQVPVRLCQVHHGHLNHCHGHDHDHHHLRLALQLAQQQQFSYYDYFLHQFWFFNTV